MNPAAAGERLAELRGQYDQDPPIHRLFPLGYDGPQRGMTWTCVRGSCGRCDAALPADCMRGRITMSTSHVHCLEAVGFCAACNVYTSYSYRMHADGTFSGLDRDGKWARWAMSPVKQSHVKVMLCALLCVAIAVIDRLIALRRAARRQLDT